MRNINTRLIILLMLSIVLFSLSLGCTNKNNDVKNDTVLNNTSSSVVPPAPKQIYIKVGGAEAFDYAGHNIEIDYTYGKSTNIIKVNVDGHKTIFQKNIDDDPAGVYQKENGLHFAIKPVIWETRGSQNVPIYEETWNTSEIYVEIWR
jgi:hypothetical protein